MSSPPNACILGVVLLASSIGWTVEAEQSVVVPGHAPSVAIPNARQPMPGVVTGGQPTRDQLEQAAAAGFKTVVNLRALSEDGAWDETEFVTKLGMTFLHLPISGVKDLSADNAAALFKVMGDPEAQPVLVHCASGNRIGALFAVKASAFDGASVDEAIELGRKAGLTRLEGATRDLLTSKDSN